MKDILKNSVDFFINNDISPFAKINRGIERECLRITSKGKISQRSHPKSLGSSLTNHFITTDYSEALLEFITPICQDVHQLVKFLEDIQKFTYKNIASELLWPFSMPCPIDDETKIPIAQYGSSNVGRMKTLYRTGLKYRYGSLMQIIAGIHYNFSMPDNFWPLYTKFNHINKGHKEFKTATYFKLIRNINRYGWIIPYLFGASPLVCKTFIKDPKYHCLLNSFNKRGLLYGPYSTSLRMSELGYQNKEQSQLDISYNDLKSYIKGLRHATNTIEPKWQEIGTKDENGDLLQLNTHILQIENEYYNSIRPKRIAQSGESPTNALEKRGVEYVELRSLDIDPFSNIGIDLEQIYFLDLFLTFCLLSEGPICNQKQRLEEKSNFNRVVMEGRKPSLMLLDKGVNRLLKDIANELFCKMQLTADLLNKANNTEKYGMTLNNLKECVQYPELTKSGRIIEKIQNSKLGFCEFSLQKAKKIKTELLEDDLEKEKENIFIKEAIQSLTKQADIEKSDSLSFGDYLENFFSQY